jgi:uncharacterized membrane protein YbhN (UPF0104 family)/tRNA A-37 threonylcarbamoyl transferase component Bud32
MVATVDQVSAADPAGVGPTSDAPKVRTYLFAWDAGAPLHRRPVDFGRLAVATVAFVLLGWAAASEPPIDARIASLFSNVPDWVRTLAWALYSGAALAALGLVIACLVRGGVKRGVARDLLLTVAVGIGIGLVAGRVATGAWPAVLPEFIDQVGSPAYPNLRPAIVVAAVLVLAPYLTDPVRRFGQWVMVAAVLSPIVLELSTLTGALGAMALGALCVAVVRVTLGSPEGWPPLSRLTATLERVDVPTTDLAYLPDQPSTVGLATAHDADGRPLAIKVYGRDAADRQREQRVWKSLWYRSSGPSPSSSPIHRVEHEALALLHADGAGVAVPHVVRAGQDEGGDVLLVLIEPDGTLLADKAAPTVDDPTLHELWAMLARLHARRQTHGALSLTAVVVGPDGPAFTDLGHSSLLPTPHQYGADIAGLLAVTAVAAGPERAVDAALQSFPKDRLVEALPYIQDAVVEPSLRSPMRHAKVKLDHVRSLLVDRLGVKAPETAKIRRVKASDIVMAVAGILAANAIISQIAQIGWHTLVEQVKTASIGWLIVAFLVMIAGYSAPWIGLNAAVTQSVPLGPCMLEQSAGSYVGLVVPSSLGRTAMDTRFLGRLGVPTATALAQGPVIGFIGFIVEVVLLLLTSWALGQNIDTGSAGSRGSGGLLILVVLIVAAGLGVTFGVPKLRAKVWPKVKTALAAVTGIITSPSRLGKIAGSELLERIVSALALGAVVAAFGASLPFGALIFVAVGTSLLAGLAPVPGGIGVAEATMTALLTGLGMPSTEAFSIAITYRVLTSYLPPVLGFFSLNWLKEHSYI